MPPARSSVRRLDRTDWLLAVAEAQPANKKPSGRPPVAGRSNLTLRIVSSLVLAPLVIAAFWAVAALAVLWEWQTLVCADERNPVLATGALTLAGAGLLIVLERP